MQTHKDEFLGFNFKPMKLHSAFNPSLSGHIRAVVLGEGNFKAIAHPFNCEGEYVVTRGVGIDGGWIGTTCYRDTTRG